MKIPVQYLNDEEGNIKAVQVSITEWQKVLSKLRKMEQAINLRKDLSEAFEEVTKFSKSKRKKETLKDFLNGV